MTDDEMVDEYLNKHNYTNSNIGYFASGCCKQAYLAGLKAGKPQWHDLRKNPDDLPPFEKGAESVSIDVLTDRGEIACYQHGHGENYWRDCNWNEIDPPIAWCEIPKYEEYRVRALALRCADAKKEEGKR